nr:hypothetical protein [Tanacetum cinerariifolium]
MVFNPVGERGKGEEIVLRQKIVKVDAQDITDANFTLSLSRLSSWGFQHEFDHLELLQLLMIVSTLRIKPKGHVWDPGGKKYLDFLAAYYAVNLVRWTLSSKDHEGTNRASTNVKDQVARS